MPHILTCILNNQWSIKARGRSLSISLPTPYALLSEGERWGGEIVRQMEVLDRELLKIPSMEVSVKDHMNCDSSFVVYHVT